MIKELQSPRYVIELSRKLRLNLTPSEQILWNKLRKRQIGGYKFRNQHPVYRYILDFYCHSKKIAIEIDGEIHKERKDYDQYRDQYLQNAGIETLRFSIDEIKNHLSAVLIKIEKTLNN